MLIGTFYTLSIILFLSHSLFIIRARYLQMKKKGNQNWDRMNMSLAQGLYPLCLLLAIIINFQEVKNQLPPHMFSLGFIPFVLMIIFRKKSLKRKHPYLLPLLVWLCYLVLIIEGVLLHVP